MTTFPINGRRIADYLDRPITDRRELRYAINKIHDRLPDTVIFGGMIRDFSLGNARSFTSDIDLVSLASNSEIQHAIEPFNPQRNKFGGFRFRVGKWRFDIWSLSQTWAFKEGIVSGVGFDDLLETTFFNVDAAFFHLGGRTILASDIFESGIKYHILDVNLEQNPAPQRMAKRAIKMAIEHDFAMSSRLVSYIVNQFPYRPLWMSEWLWGRMLEHTESKDEPLQVYKQLEFRIAKYGSSQTKNG